MILCYVLTLISFLSTKAENIEQKQATGKRPSINCINPQVADILKNEEVRSSLQLHCSNPTPYCDFEMNVCISSDENGEDMVSVRPALRTNESPAAAYHWRNTLRAGLIPSRPPPHKPVLWGHYNNIKSGHRSLESPGYWKKWTKPKTGKKRIPGGTISGASDRRREPRRNRGKTLGRRKLETEIQRQEGGPPARKIPGSAGRRKGPPPGRRKPLLPGRTKGQPPGRRKLGPPSGRIQQSPGRRRKLQRPPPGPKLSQGRGQRDATTKKSSRYKKNAPKGKEKKTLTGKKKKRHEGNGKKPSTSTKNTYYRNAKALGNEGVPPESGVWSVKPKRSMWRDLSSDDVPGISKTDGPANFCIDPKSRFFKNKNLTSQLSLRCKPPWPYCDFGANRCIRSPVKYFGCEVDGRFPHISDCASYVTCREGKSEETFCPSSMFYNHEQKKCQNGNRKCKKPNCEGVDGLYVKHPEDMSLFVLCIKGKPTSMHSCPPGFLSHDDPYTPCVQDTTCYADGNFPYPSDESRYVSCYDDGEKILKVLKYCPDHTFFVAQSGTCETKT